MLNRLLLFGLAALGWTASAQSFLPFRAPDVWQRFTANSLSQGPSRFVPDGQGGMMFWFQQLDRANGELTGAPILLRGDGSVDPAFKPGAFAFGVEAVAPASEGKWVVAYGAPGAAVVIRLLANGSPDPEFTPKGFSQGVRFLTPLPDGSVLVIVSGNQQGNPHPEAIAVPLATVVKLKANGDLDAAFNRPVLENFPFIFAPPLLDGQGRFLLGGNFTTAGTRRRFGFARYLPNGVLDSSFGGSLSLPAALGGVVRGLGFQSDGKLVVVGDIRLPATLPAGAPNTNRLVALRFDANGNHDPSFKPLRRDEIQTADFPRMLVVQPDDKIVVSAEGLRRLNSDGSFDTSFQNAVTAPTFWVGALGDGRLVLPGGLPERGVSVFSADGTPDTSYDVRGFGASVSPAFAPLADGRVALAGAFNRVEGEAANGLLILDPNGVPVPDHPGIGRLAPTAAIESPATSLDVLAANGGGLYVAGFLAAPGSQAVFSGVRRLLADGSVDAGFTAPATPPQQVFAARDGGVWLAGLSAQSLASLIPANVTTIGDPSVWLTRRTATGSLAEGYVALPAELSQQLGQAFREANGLRLQLGGVRVLSPVRGGGVVVELATVDGQVRLRKVNPDGTFAAAFAPAVLTGNQPVQGFPSVFDPVLSTTLQANTFQYAGLIRTAAELADGTLLVGGSFSQFPGAPAGQLVLLRADGTVDPGFRPAAFGSTRPFSVPSVLSVAVDGEDRLYAAGNFDRYGTTAVPGLIRLDREGRLDPTFISPLLATDYPEPAADLRLSGSTLWVGGSFRLPAETFPRPLWKLDLGWVNGLPPIRRTVGPDGQLSLSWSAGLADVVLEATGRLTADGLWEPAALPITEENGVRRVVLPASAETGFYRLRRTAE
jgi:uncharacterized delta-60 repeat protein